MPDDVALSADERAELERLWAEVADLRSQVSTVAAVLTDQTCRSDPKAAAAVVALSSGDLS